jgi:dipeptidyl aminopeptidase/acylaminoacyl peptidase
MKGLDYVLEKNSFIDKDRICALGASYGGYMVNWMNGHTDRFNCIVNHDGIFDTFGDYFATDELWFPEFEMGGTPWEKEPRKNYKKWNPASHVQKWNTPTLVVVSPLTERFEFV